MKKLSVLLTVLALYTTSIMATQTAEDITGEVLQILANSKDKPYLGEQVSQLEHALQCAQAAKTKGYDNEIIISALVHDIGHILPSSDITSMNYLGDIAHHTKGATYLQKKGFPNRIVELVRDHVPVKRFLVTTDPKYIDKVSDASKKTLQFQGGLMSNSEREAFENDPLLEDKIKIRLLEEDGKAPGKKTEPLESYREMMIAILKAANQNS